MYIKHRIVTQPLWSLQIWNPVGPITSLSLIIAGSEKVLPPEGSIFKSSSLAQKRWAWYC